ncbi:MAG: hypothetical protein BroJett040_26000 [Oligoflexia bacterium]|nr:MAG: hypothetical protein BroJett040_26000 [Oligoflexia bacterium]
MKMIASAIVTVFAAAALANPPAAPTTATPAAPAAPTAKVEDKCAGKKGKDLATCKAEVAKAAKATTTTPAAPATTHK